MNTKEKILERGKGAPKRAFEIETIDGDKLVFTIPHGGPARASYRRKRADFIAMHKDKPNPVWLQKGLVPEEGYGEPELGLIYDFHALCDQGWTQEDVLEMFKENDEELIAIGNRLGNMMQDTAGIDQAADIEAKKQSSPAGTSPTGG